MSSENTAILSATLLQLAALIGLTIIAVFRDGSSTDVIVGAFAAFIASNAAVSIFQSRSRATVQVAQSSNHVLSQQTSGVSGT